MEAAWERASTTTTEPEWLPDEALRSAPTLDLGVVRMATSLDLENDRPDHVPRSSSDGLGVWSYQELDEIAGEGKLQSFADKSAPESMHGEPSEPRSTDGELGEPKNTCGEPEPENVHGERQDVSAGNETEQADAGEVAEGEPENTHGVSAGKETEQANAGFDVLNFEVQPPCFVTAGMCDHEHITLSCVLAQDKISRIEQFKTGKNAAEDEEPTGGRGRGKGPGRGGRGRARGRGRGRAAATDPAPTVVATPEKKQTEPAGDDADMSAPKESRAPTRLRSKTSPKQLQKVEKPKAKACPKPKTSQPNPKARAKKPAQEPVPLEAEPVKKPRLSTDERPEPSQPSKEPAKDKEPAFAKRFKPEGPTASRHWLAIREVFNSELRSHFTTPGKMQDMCC